MRALNSVFNTKIKAIYGYTGVPDAMLALQRGEISGYTGIFWNQLKAGYGDLLRDKKLKISRAIRNLGRSRNAGRSPRV